MLNDWIFTQSRRVSTTTTSTTKSACGVTPAASTWPAPTRNAPDASRIRSSATCTSPTSLSWRAPISCNNCAASNRSPWAALLPDARVALRSSSRYHRKPVQVSFTQRIHLYFLCRVGIQSYHLSLMILSVTAGSNPGLAISSASL